jgi:dimethylglycine dehydrogenase
MLNRRGRIELETTIIRMAEDKFYLVCAAFFEQRSWIIWPTTATART